MQRVEWRREMTGHWIGLPVRWPDEDLLQWKRKGNWRMEGKAMGGFVMLGMEEGGAAARRFGRVRGADG